MRRFAFGKNWQRYAQHALIPAKIDQARRDFRSLFDGIDLPGKSFLDIGFGQGLSLCFAQEMGARVMGIDSDTHTAAAVNTTMRLFPHCRFPTIRIVSILDDAFLAEYQTCGQFEIVHAWGVLHHTGNMRQALRNAAQLVKAGGHLVIAIYNKHWTSPIWRMIKWAYNIAPAWGQSLLIVGAYPIIYAAKWIVTRQNPKHKHRGMDFWYDVIDWIGGYPYEYATIAEIQAMFDPREWTCVRVIPARVPTGCNQFIFRKQ